MKELFSYSKLYYERWKVTPVPIRYISDQQVPLIKWGDFYVQEEPVLIDDEKLWELTDGIAILPKQNHVVIDIDYFDGEEQRKTVARYLSKQGYVVVLTRRGLHIHFNSNNRKVGELRVYSKEGKRIGEGGGSLFKHLWAVPPTQRGSFVYRFYCTDTVPDLITVDLTEFEADIGIVFPVKIEEVKATTVTGTGAGLSEVDPIPGIEKLNADELLALLTATYHALGCYGLRDLLLEWSTTGSVKMRKFAWANRTSRFYLLHTVVTTLAILGVTEQQAAEVVNKYEDLDGKPVDAHKSALWTVYRWKAPLFKHLYVLRRGECPFCSLRNYRNCGKNAVMRVYWWLQSRGRELAEELVQHLLAKRAKD